MHRLDREVSGELGVARDVVLLLQLVSIKFKIKFQSKEHRIRILV